MEWEFEKVKIRNRNTIMDLTKTVSNNYEGFDVLDDNGNYKPFIDVIEGIAEVYEDIVNMDKSLGANNHYLLLEALIGKDEQHMKSLESDIYLVKSSLDLAKK